MNIDESLRKDKISARQSDRAAPQRAESPARPQASKAPDADNVHLSPRAREFQKARQDLATLTDEASEKIQGIRDRIQSGRYRIDADEIAAKMIREALASDE